MSRMLELMSPGQRRRLLMLLPFVAVNALIQVVGIASIMPFLALVSNPESVRTNVVLRWTFDTLGFADDRSFLVFVGVGVLVVFVFSTAFAAFTHLRLMRFAWDMNHQLSVRMLREYLYKPYVFYLDQNTAGLAKNILGEVKQAVSGFLVSTTALVAQSISALFILLLLVVVNPALAGLTFAFLGGTYWFVFGFMRRRLSAAGKRRSMADKARYKAANESLSGAKEIKLLGKEQPFLKRYITPSSRYARAMAQQQVYALLPRYAFEILAFGGLLMIVLYMLVREQNLTAVLPTLGVYAFATYRLLPALQSIFSSLSSMRFSATAVDLLHADLELAQPAQPVDRDKIAPLPFRDRLELRKLTFAYPNAPHPVFTDFDLTVRVRTSVALVGATGSGKTTAVDLLLGLLTPQGGDLAVDGVPVVRDNLSAWQKNLGYVPQHIFLADDTVEANIAFGVPANKVDRAAVEVAARKANIHDFIVGELPKGYDTEIGERGLRLSGGQRQRLGIARALYDDPEVLILDEATSALDNVTEDSVFHAVNEIGKSKTVVMIAHRISTVRSCDVIHLLQEGRIVASGSYEDLLASSSEFRTLARVDDVQAGAMAD
jgi:ABC-type bacteriocin/lantibiotic exporter with double-glycine peptidase domain